MPDGNSIPEIPISNHTSEQTPVARPSETPTPTSAPLTPEPTRVPTPEGPQPNLNKWLDGKLTDPEQPILINDPLNPNHEPIKGVLLGVDEENIDGKKYLYVGLRDSKGVPFSIVMNVGEEVKEEKVSPPDPSNKPPQK